MKKCHFREHVPGPSSREFAWILWVCKLNEDVDRHFVRNVYESCVCDGPTKSYKGKIEWSISLYTTRKIIFVPRSSPHVSAIETISAYSSLQVCSLPLPSQPAQPPSQPSPPSHTASPASPATQPAQTPSQPSHPASSASPATQPRQPSQRGQPSQNSPAASQLAFQADSDPIASRGGGYHR